MEQENLERCSCHQDIDRMINEGSAGEPRYITFSDQQLNPVEWTEEMKNSHGRLKEKEREA